MKQVAKHKKQSALPWILVSLTLVLVIFTVSVLLWTLLTANAEVENSQIMIPIETTVPAQTTSPPSTAIAVTTITPTTELRLSLGDWGLLGANLENFTNDRLPALISKVEAKEALERARLASETAAPTAPPPQATEAPAQSGGDQSSFRQGYVNIGNNPFQGNQGNQGNQGGSNQGGSNQGGGSGSVSGVSGGTGGSSGSSGNKVMSADAETMQQQCLAYINELRASLGLGTLAWDANLQQIASTRARELRQFYDSGHIRPDGSFSLNWITANWGARYAQGENIGWADNVYNASGWEVYVQFRDSPDHYDIMVNPNHTIGAIGIYLDPDYPSNNRNGRVFMCMNFGY